MTPELAGMIRVEIARLADQINELTAQRTALVKVLANGAEVPVVEAPEPPVIAFAAAKCLTPGNCVLDHGWLRAFCEKCQAVKRKEAEEHDLRVLLTVEEQRTLREAKP